MKKMKFISLISLILAIVMLAGLTSCAPRNPSVDDTTTEVPSGDTGSPEDSGTVGDATTDKETEGEKLPDTDLIYYEDFEKISLSSSSETVLRQLGWKLDGSENGAFVCYAPAETPQIAIAIYGEKAAHGNTLAEIARAMLDVRFEVGEVGDVPTYENQLS